MAVTDVATRWRGVSSRRSAVHAESYEAAAEVNRRVAGVGLSKQECL